MRYWHPSIEDAVKKMIIDGVEKVVALPLFPQYSKVTTGSCIKELNRVTARKTLDLALVNSWYENPIYLDALAQKIKEAIAQFPRPNEVKMIFSAHAIPQRLVKEGDPYIEHLKGTISGVVERLGQVSWQLAFQSQHGPIKWTGPKTASIIKKLAKENQILIIPISFVSDHLETLYEIDVEYKRLAKKFGAKYFARAPSLNVSPRFIDALADISKSALSRFH
jgi:ferrochelatase